MVEVVMRHRLHTHIQPLIMSDKLNPQPLVYTEVVRYFVRKCLCLQKKLYSFDLLYRKYTFSKVLEAGSEVVGSETTEVEVTVCSEAEPVDLE